MIYIFMSKTRIISAIFDHLSVCQIF